MGQKTLTFPNRHGVFIDSSGAYWYNGDGAKWFPTTEGLGHKNLIASWMERHAGTGRTYHRHILAETLLMASNDGAAKGGIPVIYTDEIAPGSSEWFDENPNRNQDLLEGLYEQCEKDGIALVQGESPSLPLLVRDQPVFSGCCISLLPPGRKAITRESVEAGNIILGVPSTGLHSNGSTLILTRAEQLPDHLLTKLPNGNTLGEESLIPTASYASLVNALFDNPIVEISTIVPGTGGGISKIATATHRPFTYRLFDWVPKIPPLFQFMRELGVSLRDCLTTFNWGIGYYIVVPPDWEIVDRVIQIGRQRGHEILVIGRVEDGKQEVVFEPEDNIILPPPGK